MVASYPAAVKSFGVAHQDFTENILAAHVNDVQDETVALQTTLGVAPNTGTTLVGGTTTYATLKARIDAVMDGVRTHTHDATSGVKLAQANTHQTPDTDTATTSLHHTLGAGANQAAAGGHTHTQAQSHNSPDTDVSAASLHHTLGAGANQAALGSHTHTSDPTSLSGVGVVVMCAGAAPTGYLLCDGTAVSRTTYASLYAYLGSASSPWGQGNGTSTFNVPDMRGRVPIGAGLGTGLTNRVLGTNYGSQDTPAVTHSHTGSTAGASVTHTHDVSHGHSGSTAGAGNHNHYEYLSDFGSLGGGGSLVRLGYNGGGGNLTGAGGDHSHGVTINANYFSSGGQSADHSHATTVDAAGVSGTGANIPPAVGINFAIKY